MGPCPKTEQNYSHFYDLSLLEYFCTAAPVLEKPEADIAVELTVLSSFKGVVVTSQS